MAGDPVEAEEKKIIGVAVIGADADALGVGAELGDGLDRVGERVPRSRGWAAAEEDPNAGFKEIVADLAVDGLVGVGDAGSGAGGDEFAAVDVAADGAAAFEGGGHDRVAARVAHGDLDEVHFLTESHGLRVAVEEFADFGGGEIAAGGFELGRGRGHGGGDREENGERGLAGILQHPLDAGGVADVADFMAVAKNRRRAVEQSALGVGARGHHRALDVDMRIDEAGGEDAAGGIEEFGAGELRENFSGGAGGFDGGDAAGLQPDLAVGVEALGVS